MQAGALVFFLTKLPCMRLQRLDMAQSALQGWLEAPLHLTTPSQPKRLFKNTYMAEYLF